MADLLENVWNEVINLYFAGWSRRLSRYLLAGLLTVGVGFAQTREESRPMNRIANLKTVKRESKDGPVNVIVMGLTVGDPKNADVFLQEVLEKFKAQRMDGPKDTRIMVVTIIGELSATDFAARWRKFAKEDASLRTYMAQMTLAEVVRGTADGKAQETVSLIDK